jgi:hypothetical protein
LLHPQLRNGFTLFDENDPTVITAGEYVVPIASRGESDFEENLLKAKLTTALACN